ncbi:MAG: hypothetical protein AAB332_01915 [Planctomycetota bacterium]
MTSGDAYPTKEESRVETTHARSSGVTIGGLPERGASLRSLFKIT